MGIKSCITLIILIVIYRDSYSQDTTKNYYPSGKIGLAQVRIDSINMYEKTYYESGNIKSEGYVRFLQGKWRLQNFKSFYESGSLWVHSCDTSITMYDEDGKIYSHQQVLKGVMNGKGFLFIDGELLSVKEFKNDKLDGLRLTYGSKGRLSIKETYKEDKREGVAEFFDSTGRVIERRIYKSDKPVNVTYFDSEGKIIRVTDGTEEYLKEKQLQDLLKNKN